MHDQNLVKKTVEDLMNNMKVFNSKKNTFILLFTGTYPTEPCEAHNKQIEQVTNILFCIKHTKTNKNCH